MKKVIVVGSGLGGLRTAINLLNKGYSVTIIEKEKTLGGKINYIKEGDFKFDLTASILMTPNSYIDTFKDVNKDYRDYIHMFDLDPLYRVYGFDKSDFRVYQKSDKTLRALEKLRGNLPKEYIRFLESSNEKYEISKKAFLDKPMVSFKEIFSFDSISSFFKLHPLKSNYDYTKDIIKNNRFLEYLLFTSMYIGCNPYKNTNIYSLIPAITQLYGLVYIKGGFYSYIEALEKLILELGGEILTETNVSEIVLEDRKVKGVIANGNKISSDIVVCSADYPYAINNLFKEEVGSINKKDTENMELSPSVFIIYLGLSEKLENLEVHNIYLNDDFREGIEAPFNLKLPKKPSVYLYYPSKVDDTLAKGEKSILNLVVRVPNLKNEEIIWDDESIKEYRDIVINSIKKINGLYNIEDIIEFEKVLTPKDLEEKFNLYKGAAFGISHKLNQSGYFRPHLKGRGTKGLYFISASTHPGNGASVALDGGKVLGELIEKENPI